MMLKDKDLVWSLIICLSFVFLFMSFAYFDYKKSEKELSQPKYCIEFNQELYELKRLN